MCTVSQSAVRKSSFSRKRDRGQEGATTKRGRRTAEGCRWLGERSLEQPLRRLARKADAGQIPAMAFEESLASSPTQRWGRGGGVPGDGGGAEAASSRRLEAEANGQRVEIGPTGWRSKDA